MMEMEFGIRHFYLELSCNQLDYLLLFSKCKLQFDEIRQKYAILEVARGKLDYKKSVQCPQPLVRDVEE